MLAAVVLALSVQAHAAEPPLLWSITLDGSDPVVVSTWSPNDACLAAATKTTVHVLDRTGRPLWRWEFARTTRFLHPGIGQALAPLAVSPTCDAIAIAGGSDYRYVWLADRSGRRAAFKTVGTVHAVRFDNRGEVVAVGTGAARGYLIARRFRQRWAGHLIDLPVTWPGEQVDDPALEQAVLPRGDVEMLFAVAAWGLGIRDEVSDDGQWRAIETWPYRGPGTGVVKFWGPHARGFRQRIHHGNEPRPRWSVAIGCAESRLASDGQFLIVKGDLDHAEYNESGDQRCSGDDLPTLVFDRDGHIVTKSPATAGSEQIADAVLAASGTPLLVRPRTAWTRPFMDFVDVLASDRTPAPRTREYSHDQTLLLATRDREIRVYARPE